MFLSFINFYWIFIQDFGKIAALLTLMLMTFRFKVLGFSALLAPANEVNIIDKVASNNKVEKGSKKKHYQK